MAMTRGRARRTGSQRAMTGWPRTQRTDGSWPMKLVGGEADRTPAASPTSRLRRRRRLAPAAGDRRPALRRADVAGRPVARSTSWSTCRPPGGEIVWERDADGRPADVRPAHRLLLASTSRCAAACRSPSAWASRSPTGSSPPTSSATCCARHPEAFADKSRFSMDWYYPVLGGAVRGAAAAARLAEELGHVRGAGPGRPLRLRPAVGDRRGDVRAGARAGRHGRPRTGRCDSSRTCSTCGTRTAPTGPAGSSRTSELVPARTLDLHRRRRRARGRRADRPHPGRGYLP